MDCKTAEREIEPFFDDELDNEELERFLAHIDTCESCREELTIRLLIRIGLKRLEDGRNFHLGHEMDQLMRSARARLLRRKRLQRLAGLGVSAVVLAVIAVMIIAWFTFA